MGEDSKINQTELAESVAPVLYLHVYNSGEVFILPDDGLEGIISDHSRLKAECSRLEELKGSILYSYDDPDTFSELAKQVIGFVLELELLLEFTAYPHPQVYGFDNSYALHLFHAIEYAEIDLEGLEGLLNSCGSYLKKI